MGDAFDVLGIAPGFCLQLTELEARQRDRLAQIKRSSADQPHADYSSEAEVHQAYVQLKDPASRAEVLLARQQQTVAAKPSPALLSQVFERREALEQAVATGDLASVSSCVDAALSRQVALVHVLTAHFEKPLTPGAAVPGDVQSALHELKYLKKIISKGEQAIDDLG